MALLEVKDLQVFYNTIDGDLKAVDGVSFEIPEKENLGLVGESGCGKTTVARALMMLLPKNGRVAGGEILFKGQNIAGFSRRQINKIRWTEISMIPQSAMNSLNPVYQVGDQIVEAIRAHSNLNNKEALKKTEELFDIVGLEKKRLKAFPHQMSGGMKQRAIIAMAMALEPSLILADEPTTALDVVVQDRILKKILEVQKQMGSSMVFITHDISVVAETCQMICIMYAGKIAEIGPTRDIFKDPRHPYTMGLQNAFPSIQLEQTELISIPGFPPDLLNPPQGCRFFERCPFSTDKCEAEDPPMFSVNEKHKVACHYADQYEVFREQSKKGDTWEKMKQRQIERGVV